MPSRIFSRPDPDGFRASLRRAMPEPERRLWRVLRRRQLGVRFRRQHGIGPYVVDFYAAALKLVIELDGDSHFLDEAAVRNDAVRDRYLAGLGMRVLRYGNGDVMRNIEGVVADILRVIELG